MKKLITIVAFAAITIGAFASTVKYGDIINTNEAGWEKLAKEEQITKDTVVEVNDIKTYSEYVVKALVKDNAALRAEFDQMWADRCNAGNSKETRQFNTSGLTKTLFPKMFAAKVAYLAKTKPTLATTFDNAGVFGNWTTWKTMDVNDLISVLNAGEADFDCIDSFNKVFKDKAVRVVKIAIRKSGKSFVAKKDKDGKVTENPLTAPMKELTDALNAPRYAGFNEWVEKYNAGWKKLDLSWLKSDEELKKLMDDILIDDASFDKNSAELRLCLGVEKFNEFVKLYNDGAAK